MKEGRNDRRIKKLEEDVSNLSKLVAILFVLLEFLAKDGQTMDKSQGDK